MLNGNSLAYMWLSEKVLLKAQLYIIGNCGNTEFANCKSCASIITCGRW